MAENKKKYPWFKSIFQRKTKVNPAAGVYAGPEEMARRSGSKKPSDDDGPIDVYAGPEYFEQDPDIEDPDVRTAPDRRPEPEMPVYAGPEHFDPNKKVYAGPEYQTPPMMVYAGPEYFRNRANPGIGAYAPPVSEDPDTVCEEQPEEIPEGFVKCPACGNVYPADSKFCPECGTVTKGPELMA